MSVCLFQRFKRNTSSLKIYVPNDVLCAKIQQWTNVPVPCAHTLWEDMESTLVNVSDQSLEEKKKKGSIRKIMIFQKSAKTSLIRWHLLWTWEWGRQLCRYLGKDRNRAKTLSGMCSLRRGRRGLSMAWVVWASKSRWEMRPSVEMGLGGESGAYPVGLHASQLQARHPIKCLT